tara:strand:- start:444 stop:1025 length:582 start_codon:yes stop_codon:yes gene_type:complete
MTAGLEGHLYGLARWALLEHEVLTCADIGCGQGLWIETLAEDVGLDKCVGVEAFGPYVERCIEDRKGGIEWVHTTGLEWLGAQPTGFWDAVLLLDVIEHQTPAESAALLSEARRVARKIVVLYTPMGFRAQAPEDVKDRSGEPWTNPHQEHKCGWDALDLRECGFSTRLLSETNCDNTFNIFAWTTRVGILRR